MFNSDEEVVVQQRQLYTGLAKVKPVLLNPTLKALNDLNINLNEQPTYLDEDQYNDNAERIRYDFWLQLPIKSDEPAYTKVSFFVTNKIRISRTNKTQYTNDFNQYSYAKDDPSETYDWFKNEGVRPALIGEENLVEFIKMWGNVKSDEKMPVSFDNAFEKGRAYDIRQYANQIFELGNKVEVLLTVNQGKYQNVYTGTFGRANINNVNKFKNELSNLIDYYQSQGKSMKFDFQNSLQFQKYEASVDFEDQEIKDVDEMPSDKIAEDDIPF